MPPSLFPLPPPALRLLPLLRLPLRPAAWGVVRHARAAEVDLSICNAVVYDGCLCIDFRLIFAVIKQNNDIV